MNYVILDSRIKYVIGSFNSNNIAEGFDRSSDADFSRFLYIAIGSASETKSMPYLAERLKFIDSDKKYDS